MSAGEAEVGAVLDAMAASGWSVLHDLAHPDGGNIDHLAVGPPGIAVVDTKNWSTPVTITPDRRLVSGKHDHTSEVNRLLDTVEWIRSLVAREGVHVAVRGYLVLVGDADRDRAATDLGDLRVLGVEHLTDRLLRARGDLDPHLVDAVWRTLGGALRPATERALPPPPPGSASGTAAEVRVPAEPSELFDKAHRFFYLRPWRKGGHHRLYLMDPAGTNLGWTDVNTGATVLECEGDDAKLAAALLAAADPTGMKLAPGDLPKVPTRLWGGRLLSRIARFHTSVLIGHEWRNYGKHRLYGSLIDPAVTTYDLGFVDLRDRTIHPSVEGDLAADRGPAGRYLEYLLARFPERR